MRRHSPPEPKPYDLIDLPFGRTISRTTPKGHHQYIREHLSGRLELTVEALTPVHVASGLMPRIRHRQYPLVKALLRVGETPIIPGSSFKGCVRSIIEAITASCVRATRTRDIPREMKGCNRKEKLCLTCRLFGAQDYQGRLRFDDLKLQGNPRSAIQIAPVPPFFRPRQRENRYYTIKRGRRYVRGRKFYLHGNQQARGNTPIEVCKRGSHFTGTLDFINLTPEELGLLLVALGQSNHSPLFLKLGGAKPACYGSLKVTINTLALLTSPAERYADWDAPTEREADVQKYVPKARPLILGLQFNQLVETLKWPNERGCPSGNY